VLVHAVGLDTPGIDLVRRRGASIVWCPSSNQFLLGATLRVEVRGSGIPVALGSDSALTASGDLLDEMRVARECGADPETLYRMVTGIPARMLRLQPDARDLAVFRDIGKGPAETLLSGALPEMVVLRGRVKLISPALAKRIGGRWERFHLLALDGRPAVLVDADIPALYRRAAQVLGEVRLAGRRVNCEGAASRP